MMRREAAPHDVAMTRGIASGDSWYCIEIRFVRCAGAPIQE
jgi:hypothetical protein